MSKKIFLDKIKKIDRGYETLCWEWQGYRNRQGYGIYKRRLAHRFSAMLFKDFDINSKLYVCHHCDNPPCSNPDHLFIGTQKDNISDMAKKGRIRSGNKHHMFGKKTSEETKRKISDSTSGNKNHMYGKTGILSTMYGRSGEKSPRYGISHTEETKRKISIAHKVRLRGEI